MIAFEKHRILFIFIETAARDLLMDGEGKFDFNKADGWSRIS